MSLNEPLLFEILDEQEIFEVDTEEIRSLCETILDDSLPDEDEY